MYDENGSVRHITYNDATFWSPSSNTVRGGPFQGEPVLVPVGPDRFEFLGVGMDRALYHFTWTDSNGYSQMQNLGGSFLSVPVGLSPS